MGPGGPGPGGPGGGPRGMRGPGGKPKNAKAAIGRIFSYIKNDVPLLIIVLLCVLTNTGCSLVGSYLLRPIINNLGDDAAAYIAASSSAAQAEILANGVSALLKGLLLMMTVYMFSVACSYAQSRIMVSISQRAIRNMRNDLFKKMQELPIRFFDTNNHGDLMSRFTNDPVSVVEELIGIDLPNDQVEKLVEGIKAKIDLDKLGGMLGGLFGKK